MSKKKKIELTVLILLMLLVVFSLILDIKQIILSFESLAYQKEYLASAGSSLTEWDTLFFKAEKTYFIRYSITCFIDIVFFVVGIFAIIKTIKNK